MFRGFVMAIFLLVVGTPAAMAESKPLVGQTLTVVQQPQKPTVQPAVKFRWSYLVTSDGGSVQRTVCTASANNSVRRDAVKFAGGVDQSLQAIVPEGYRIPLFVIGQRPRFPTVVSQTLSLDTRAGCWDGLGEAASTGHWRKR